MRQKPAEQLSMKTLALTKSRLTDFGLKFDSVMARVYHLKDLKKSVKRKN